jgi:hypothetical protein
MTNAWAEVRRLIDVNATHRSGVRVGETDDAMILAHAEAELRELVAAPDDPEELADLFGVLIHYAVKHGWSERYIEDLMLAKFRLRFTETKEDACTSTP